MLSINNYQNSSHFDSVRKDSTYATILNFEGKTLDQTRMEHKQESKRSRRVYQSPSDARKKTGSLQYTEESENCLLSHQKQR
jgi:hypothetical protein